ncbi:MAG: hypothetical protein QW655_03115 [Nitrososphaerota archaeon]
MSLSSLFLPSKLIELITSDRRELKKRLSIGVILFVASILFFTFLYYLFIMEKFEARFELTGFESVSIPIPDFNQILLSRVIYMSIAVAVIFLVMRIALQFLRIENAKSSVLITFILNSFIIILIVLTIFTPLLLTQPKTEYIIVDVELQNATLYNVTLSGYGEDKMLSLKASKIDAGYVRAYRVYPDMSLVDWQRINASLIEKTIKESRTLMNMTGLKWVEDNVEKTLDKLDLAVGSWDMLTYRFFVNAVWINVSTGIAYSIFSMVSPVSWGLLLLYNVRCFMKAYKTSTMVAVAIWILIYLVFFLTGVI